MTLLLASAAEEIAGHSENIQIALTIFVAVVGFFVGVIAWFLRRDVARLESMLAKLDAAREEDRLTISSLKEWREAMRLEVKNVRKNVHALRNQLTAKQVIGPWPDSGSDD